MLEWGRSIESAQQLHCQRWQDTCVGFRIWVFKKSRQSQTHQLAQVKRCTARCACFTQGKESSLISSDITHQWIHWKADETPHHPYPSIGRQTESSSRQPFYLDQGCLNASKIRCGRKETYSTQRQGRGQEYEHASMNLEVEQFQLHHKSQTLSPNANYGQSKAWVNNSREARWRLRQYCHIWHPRNDK